MVEASLRRSINAVRNPNSTIKFLCSYGGKILPRFPDGKLRYVGGIIRVLAVDRSVSYAELLVKLGELCGSSVVLKCQLPTEDLDALISVTSDEDLANIIEEYDRASQSAAAAATLKIRAFLSPPKSLKKVSVSPPPSLLSPTSVIDSSAIGGYGYGSPVHSESNIDFGNRFFHHQISTATPVGIPVGFEKSTGGMLVTQTQCGCFPERRSLTRDSYLVHNGNFWQ